MPRPSVIKKRIDLRPYEYQVIPELGGTVHLKIWRRDGKEIRCCWDVLQAIKNEAIGEDVMAIEVYPPEHEVVNEVNMRHLWSIPEDRFDFIPTLNR